MKNESAQIPEVIDKRTKPPGILPRNIQTLVLGGIALVMILVIVFSGSRTPKPRVSPTSGSEGLVVPPNEDKLTEYKRRIEEEAQKLRAETGPTRPDPNGVGGDNWPADPWHEFLRRPFQQGWPKRAG